MASPGEHPDEHLGEAETITLISSRKIEAILATDDKNAAAFAKPIPTVNTWQLVRLCFRAREVTWEEVRTLWILFQKSGGIVPYPINSEAKFQDYIEH